ncbi:hypothetical protein ABE112_27415 [Priestia aryabhattai]|uniref:hypothetical protein n=1 Tax=Priestia TaxID=2800373 RepID=UPI001E60EA71|nr:hypothetical protein [Priestia megaterium]MCE4092798.1 hypothetical protein [Priestia megaterium]
MRNSSKIEFTPKTIIWLVVISFITGSLIFMCGIILYKLNLEKLSYAGDLVGGIGGVVGGFIGGIVAYIVASFQIKKASELERQRSVSNNCAYLRLLKNEMDTNKKLLSRCKQSYFDNDKTFLKFLSIDIWDKCCTSIGLEIREETLNSLMSVYRKINLIKSEQEFDEQTYETLLQDIEDSLRSVETDLQTLSNEIAI